MFLNFIISLIGSSTIALFGWKFKAISPTGTIATILLGTILGTVGNIATWSVIIFLFTSSFFIQLFKQIFFSSSLTIEQLIHEKKALEMPHKFSRTFYPQLFVYFCINKPIKPLF